MVQGAWVWFWGPDLAQGTAAALGAVFFLFIIFAVIPILLTKFDAW